MKMKEKRSKIREKLSLRAVGLILAMSMVAGTLLPVGVGAEELPVDINDINNEEITVTDVMMYEDTDMSEDEEENEAAAETEEVIDVVSEENSEEAPAETSEPEAAEPETTESEVSESEVSEPEVSEPEVTEPEVPDFEETEPDEIITEEELPADAPEEEIYFCGIEEHEHTEECRNAPKEPDGEIIVEEELPEEEPQPEEEPGELYCGYEVHVHDDTCWNEEYLADCGMEEHEHSENCYSLAYTLMAEFAAAVELFPDEADYILLDFDEADGSELLDEEAYYAAYAAFYEENPDIWMTTDALFAEAEAAYAEENPDGDIDAWMQDNGFWEAAEKFYWVVPTPDAVAEKTAQMEEVELEFTAEEETPVLYADDIVNVETSAPAPGVTVKLFNYDEDINKHTDKLGFMVGGKTEETFDQTGRYVPDHIERNISADSALGDDGYPYITTTIPKGNYAGQKIGSLAYLFNEKEVDGKTFVSTMSDGGGLFRKIGDNFVYDSANNAAYYDVTQGQFVLYKNAILQPNTYDGYDGKETPVSDGNFIPFNAINSDTVESEPVRIYQADTDNEWNAVTAYELKDDKTLDLWFGMTIEFEFYMPKDGKVNEEDMVFEFFGDDDVFVYIDNTLVLDIGGIHAAHEGSINFATGVVKDHPSSMNDDTKYLTPARERTLKEIFDLSGDTFDDYTKHTLKFFYLERGANISYCKIKFNLPTLPDNSITVGKELTVADATGNITIENILKNTLTYKFRVMDSATGKPVTKDSNGNFISYKVYKEGSYDESDRGTYEVRIMGEDGIIELKSGERALIENTLDIFGKNGANYYVQELIPDDISGQYAGVEVTRDLEGTSVDVSVDGGASMRYIGYNTDEYNSLTDGSTYSVFNNKVNTSKLSSFSVTKAVTKSSNFTDEQTFYFKITFGGEPLAKTEFQVSKAGAESVYTRPTDDEGILEMYVGETAVLMNLLSGTKYEVYEVGGEEYYVTYDATVKCHCEEQSCDCEPDIQNGVKDENDGLVSGELSLNSSVEITATNSTYDVEEPLDLYIKKIITGNMGDRSKEFNFKFEIVQEEQSLLLMMSSAEDIPTGDIGTDKTIKELLGHEEQYHIVGIEPGTKIRITEIPEGYTPTVMMGEKKLNVVKNDDGSVYVDVVVTVENSGGYIVFTNDKTATIDTAVHLDYLPYILILTAVIPTMTLAVSRKRRRRED